MALTNSQYNTIMKTYEEKQLASRQELDVKIAHVNKNVPRYQELSEQISSLAVKQAFLMLEQDEVNKEEFKNTLDNLRKEKAQVLLDAGYPADYLEPVFVCPDCKDTGYIGLEKCHCFKQQIINLLYQQSNIHEMLKETNFSNLSYEYYEGEDFIRFTLN